VLRINVLTSLFAWCFIISLLFCFFTKRPSGFFSCYRLHLNPTRCTFSYSLDCVYLKFPFLPGNQLTKCLKKLIWTFPWKTCLFCHQTNKLFIYSELITFHKEKRINRVRFSSNQFMSYCCQSTVYRPDFEYSILRKVDRYYYYDFKRLKWQNVI
jgi:hypothetical protein